ncbi:unnamed protein product [Gordionus sp. m RMFG-2023]|uniref:tRNA (adenine(58)-N(1))-methyltransferase catalytic subunit TRMT61A-like n=1 Tax=Gordionus sp. m RMFG-2023 TaxID=3053472 RepID=UPI0030E28063
MNFLKYKEYIEEGDLIIVWQGRTSQFCFNVFNGEMHQTKYGAIKHADLIGKKYGSKFPCGIHKITKEPTGWIYILHPNLEAWTKLLPHRTQILYPTDISIIMFELDITPGKIVCESGTGSGSLSHYILNGIIPGGHLFTYDIDKNRCDIARKEFSSHGYKDGIDFTVITKNVCLDGFDIPENEKNKMEYLENIGIDSKVLHLPKANIIILDLPTPWLAIPNITKIFRYGGRIVSFSPCIEQVQRSVEALKSNNFCHIKTVECMAIPYNFKEIILPDLKTNKMTDGDNQALHEKNDTSDLNYSVLSRLPKFTSHTGYLTFATLFPK